MENIQSYLKRFEVMQEPDKALREALVTILHKYGIIVTKKHINVKNNLISIKVPSLVRSEIYIRKQAILSELPAHTISGVYDIR